MNSDYVAWNGERYVWPPPEGWYHASDGRWWAPDTGPEMDLEASPTGSGSDVGSVDAGGYDEQLGDVDPVDHGGPAGGVEPPVDADSAAHFSATPAAESSTPVAESRGMTPSALADTGRPVTGQVAAVPDLDATGALAPDHVDGRNRTMVMAEPTRTQTGSHPTVAADPDTGRHDRVPILESAGDETPSAGIQRSRTMSMVAAGLLAAAAIGIAALLALLGGDNETQTQQPSLSAEDTDEGSDGLVVSTDDSGTPTSAGGAMDDGAMDDGAMDDDAMSEDDGAMTEGGDASTSTTAVDTAEAPDSAALIGQFRTLLEDNQITAAALTGDDLVVFGRTACSYATSAGDLPEYEQIRDEALNGAQNQELSIDELQFVVDAAVTVFCAEDATRLGVTATAPVEG